jgi:hypothetical protein
MYVIWWNRKVGSHSKASHKWDLSRSAVENRFSNDYMSSEGVTDAERDEGMIVDAAKITTTHLLHM